MGHLVVIPTFAGNGIPDISESKELLPLLWSPITTI